MKLTLKKRLIICFEVLFARSGHAHCAQEKDLPVFKRGYDAGMKDKKLELDNEDSVSPIVKGDEVLVFDRYRFAIALNGVVVNFSSTNDGVQVRLLKSNNVEYPIGSMVWVHENQLRKQKNEN